MYLTASSLTDPGVVRSLNEDSIFSLAQNSLREESRGLFIVADGMGGHQGGEIASKLAIETIVNSLSFLFPPDDPRRTIRLQDENEVSGGAHGRHDPTEAKAQEYGILVQEAIVRANEAIQQLPTNQSLGMQGAGTTITLLLVFGQLSIVANIGDSRTYLCRGKDLVQITQDHSLVASLVRAGQINSEDIYTHPQRNFIYRSLGAGTEEVEVDIFWQAVFPGDQFLLCSDGLWEMVRDPQIREILLGEEVPACICRRLVESANMAGGVDNISVIVVRISELE